MNPDSGRINNSGDDDNPRPPKISRGTQSEQVRRPPMRSQSTQTDPEPSTSRQQPPDCNTPVPSTSSEEPAREQTSRRHARRRLPTVKVCAYCQRRVTVPYSRQWERTPAFVKERWMCLTCREFPLFNEGFTPPDELRRQNLDPAARKELDTLDMYERYFILEEKYSITLCCIFCMFIILLILFFGFVVFMIISRLIRYFF